MTEDQMSSSNAAAGPLPVYMVEFLYKDKPDFSKELFYAALQKRTGTLKISEPGSNTPSPFQMSQEDGVKPPSVIYHVDHTVNYEDAEIPAQTCLYDAHLISDKERFEHALQQSWHWDDAREAVGKCTYSIRLHDLFTVKLPHQQRLALISAAIQALQEVAPCEAIYWQASDTLVHPEAYLEALRLGQVCYGAVNVRLYYTGAEREGRREIVLDTLGLYAFGLPDLQSISYEEDPAETARHLLVLAGYLFKEGPVFKEGQWIGVTKVRKYRCAYKSAIAAPARPVIDLEAAKVE